MDLPVPGQRTHICRRSYSSDLLVGVDVLSIRATVELCET